MDSITNVIMDVLQFLQSQRIKNGILFALSLTLIILSILNIRSSNEKDDKDTKSAIKTINICSLIIIGLSLIVLFRASYVFYVIRNQGSYYSDKEDTINTIILGLPIIVFIVSVIQKVSISNILPDMDNQKAVDDYDKNHTLKAQDVKGSSDAIFYTSLAIFLMTVIYFVYNKYSSKKINITKETQYDKVMKILKGQLQKEESEFNDAIKSNTASQSWLEDRQQEIERLKVSILSLKTKRDQSVQQETKDITSKYLDTKSALSRAQERTLDEAQVMSEGTVDVEQIVPSHLKRNAEQPTLMRTPKIVISSSKALSNSSSTSGQTMSSTSGGQSTKETLDILKAATDVVSTKDALEKVLTNFNKISSGKTIEDVTASAKERYKAPVSQSTTPATPAPVISAPISAPATPAAVISTTVPTISK